MADLWERSQFEYPVQTSEVFKTSEVLDNCWKYYKGTQLVVMSACQTGLGDVADGEGIYGLRRSLVLAGAETQVMTLWAVYDEATRYFMASYYAKLKTGSDRAAALRQVQLDFLNNNNSMYHHPAAWAAFTLTGNWRSLPE